MKLKIYRSDEKSAWNKFVSAHPYGGVEQTWEWGELQTRIPGRPSFMALGAVEGEKLVAGILLIRQNMGGGKSWLWGPRAPLLPKAGGAEAWQMLLSGMKVEAKKAGDVFIRLEPGIPVEEPFVVSGKPSENRYYPEHTLVLDLNLSEDALLEQMTQKGRYHIKQAEKQSVAVDKVGEQGIGDFYALLADTAGRDEFSVHKENFYKDFLKSLQGKLYLAKQNGETVAGILVTYFGETATYYYGASSSSHRDSKAPYLLQWTAIRDAKAAGMKVYDFLGIAPEGEEKHAWAGVTQFKTRFGGKRVSYHCSQVFVLRPLWWLIYRLAKKLRP